MRFVPFMAIFAGAIALHSAPANAQACGDSLTVNTTLTANLSCVGTGLGLSIGANGVTLDGGGFTLSVDGNVTAVNAAGRNNTTVTNLAIAGGNVGVTTAGGSAPTITNNTFTGCAQPITVGTPSAGPVTITGNTMSNGNGYGIALAATNVAAGNIVLGNNSFSGMAGGYSLTNITGPFALPVTDTFTDTGHAVFATQFAAVFIQGSSGVTIDGVSLPSGRGQGYGVWLQNTTDTVITGSTAIGHNIGVFVTGSADGLTFTNNDLSDNNASGIDLNATLATTNNIITITGNDVGFTNPTNGGWGMVLRIAGIDPNTELVFENNDFTNHTGGVYFTGVAGPWTLPTTNTFTNTGYNSFATQLASIRIDQGTSVTIENQTTLTGTGNSGYGIWLQNTVDAVVTNNIVTGHAGGFFATGTLDGLTLTNNDFSDNAGNGVDLNATLATTNNNITITGNDVGLTNPTNGGWGMVLRIAGIDPNTELVFENNDFTNHTGGVYLTGVAGPWTLPTTNTFTNTGYNAFATQLASIRIDQGTSVTIENQTTLTGTGNSGYGIWLQNTVNAVVTNNVVTNHAGGFFATGTLDGLVLTNNDMTNNFGNGVDINATLATTNGILNISGNDLSLTNPTNGGWAMVLRLAGIAPATELVLENNDFTNHTGGLYVQNATGPWTIPPSNTFTNTGYNSFATQLASVIVDNSSNVVVNGLVANTATNTGYGVWLRNTTGALVSGNTLNGHLHGIFLDGTNADIVLQANTIDGAQAQAINFAAPTGSLTVTNNRLRSNTSQALFGNIAGLSALAVSGNDLTDSAFGFLLDNADADVALDFSNQDFGNSGTNNSRYALWMRNAANTVVSGVRGDCNQVGTLVRLENTAGVTLAGVTACDRNIGVHLVNADNTSVSGAFAGNNTGVLIDAQSTGVVVDGVFFDNGADVTDNQGSSALTINVMPDADNDGIGDACDLCQGDNALGDPDSDGICGEAQGIPGGLLIRLTDLVVDDPNCPTGGVRIDVGVDNGDDGGVADNALLEDGEIDQTSFVCNGASGPDGQSGLPAVVRLTDEAEGANCTSGGVLVETGIDLNGNGVLDDDEVTDSAYVCDGAPGAAGALALVVLTTLDVGSAECPNGGTLVEAGVDTNQNGALDVDEVTSTTAVCNGADGADGDDGVDGVDGNDGANGAQSLVETEALAEGSAACPTGGVAIRSGVDSDRDGVLDSDEVTSTTAVCNGAAGPTGPEGREGPEGPAGADDTGGCSGTGVPRDGKAWPALGLLLLLLRRRRDR